MKSAVKSVDINLMSSNDGTKASRPNPDQEPVLRTVSEGENMSFNKQNAISGKGEGVNSAVDQAKDFKPKPDRGYIDESKEEVIICQLKSSSCFSVPLSIEGIHIHATIDSAAEVTIISDRVLAKFTSPPPIIRSLTFNTAARDSKMSGKLVGPVDIQLGSHTFHDFIFVAPIVDDMLLGLDLMKKYGFLIDIPAEELLIKGIRIPMIYGRERDHRRYPVRLYGTTLVPPWSAARVNCSLDVEVEGAVLFEPDPGLPVLVPRTLHSGTSQFSLYVLNPTEQPVKLEAGKSVGEGFFVEELGKQPIINEVNLENGVPEHLQTLFDESSEHLDSAQKEKLSNLLFNYGNVFAEHEFDLGNFNLIKHRIDTGDAAPIKLKMRRTPLNFVDEEKNHLKKMLDAGVIEPSVSEWAAPPVLVRKRDGGVRWCIDYRKLNDVTKKDVYPLPSIEECIDTLGGNQWFSKLDANAAYWQVHIDQKDREKTAFITKYGLFHFVRMGFGLCNAPATFSRVMDLILSGLNWNISLAFLDDVIVLGRTFDDHLHNLELVLGRFQTYGLKLKAKKCSLFQQRVEFLGREIDAEGLHLKQQHIQAVLEWPRPTSIQELQRFLGLVNYHRLFLKNCAEIADPLYALTSKKRAFIWEEHHQQAFEELKQSLVSAPVLALPNCQDEFILDTDASHNAIGAELLQVQNGVERVIAYGSLSLSPEQRRYCVTRKELLAVVKFVQQYRHFLLGKPFKVRTDHDSLRWLLNFREPHGQLARWLEVLSQYDLFIEHRPGKKHSNADALSRRPDHFNIGCENYSLGVHPTDLPCGGCSYCERAHKNWSTFASLVDNVIPLSKQEHVSEDHSSDMCITYMDISVGDKDPNIFVQGEDNPSYSFVKGEASKNINQICPDSDEFTDAQAKDPFLSYLKQYLVDQSEPNEGVIMLWGERQKAMWIARDNFCLKDGIIYKKSSPNDRIVVPVSLQQNIISLNHDLPLTGHAGIDRTLAKIKGKYYWRGLTVDVKAFVTKCAICNTNKKPRQKGKFPMTIFHSGIPMERVHLDFLGPLPKTKQGNQYILVIVDQFTKWVECIPLPAQTAEVTARAAVNEFFSRFGCPLQIFTDQGRNFESHLFRSMCKLLKINKTRTTAYRPSANGQVERFNRTLMDAIRCFINSSPSDWDYYLPQLAGAIRSTVNRSTGFTPNMLMLGREVTQPVELVYPLPPKEKPELVDQYCATLRDSLERAHDTARDKLQSVVNLRKRDYDIKIKQHSFDVGDRVYILNFASKPGKGRKLQSPWKGPATIISKINPYLYQVAYHRTTYVVNHDQLKLCTDDSPVPSLPKRGNRKEQYCLCRQADDGSFMIQCDFCLEWYHGRCIQLTREEGEAMDRFRCPVCGLRQKYGLDDFVVLTPPK